MKVNCFDFFTAFDTVGMRVGEALASLAVAIQQILGSCKESCSYLKMILW